MALVGVTEAAAILGWDRRKVSTYIKRGVFPEPLQRLAGGPVWQQETIEQYRDNLASRPRRTRLQKGE
jgi:hypothetical protein